MKTLKDINKEKKNTFIYKNRSMVRGLLLVVASYFMFFVYPLILISPLIAFVGGMFFYNWITKGDQDSIKQEDKEEVDK